jgi:cold shock CspA family protein
VVSGVELMSTAGKDHWDSERSPWTEQQLDYYYSFKGPQSRPSAKAVILDGKTRRSPDPIAVSKLGPVGLKWTREGGPDVFVHVRAVEKTGYTSLAEGARVSYELKADRSEKMSAKIYGLSEF